MSKQWFEVKEKEAINKTFQRLYKKEEKKKGAWYNKCDETRLDEKDARNKNNNQDECKDERENNLSHHGPSNNTLLYSVLFNNSKVVEWEDSNDDNNSDFEFFKGIDNALGLSID